MFELEIGYQLQSDKWWEAVDNAPLEVSKTKIQVEKRKP